MMRISEVGRQKTEDRHHTSDKNSLLVTCYSLLVTVFILFTANSYASNYQITNIEVLDNAVAIKISDPIKYKIYNPADPFRVIVDIEGVALGKFKEKIYSKKAGITEIAFTQIETPVVTSRLDILLQAPSAIKTEIRGNELILYIEDGKNVIARGDSNEAISKDEIASPSARNESLRENTAKEIAVLLFDKTDEGIEFVIKGDGIMPEPTVFEIDGKVIIDIPNVLMKASIPSSMLHPVKDIKYKAEKEKVRFILDIEGKVDTEVFALEDEIVVDIAFKDKKGSLAKKEDIKKGTPNSKLPTCLFKGKGL
jgi:hypothetical protein